MSLEKFKELHHQSQPLLIATHGMLSVVKRPKKQAFRSSELQVTPLPIYWG